MTELELYRRDIENGDGTTGPVDALVDQLRILGAPSQVESLLARINDEALKLPWCRDSDYAALAVQSVAEESKDLPLRRALLSFALSRARWCASCASAGGEGLARSVHVRELEALIHDAA